MNAHEEMTRGYDLEQRVLELTRERDVFQKALEFYANIRNYDDQGCPGKGVGGGWAGTEPQDADWEGDYGERAREALGWPDPWDQDEAALSATPQAQAGAREEVR